jgi:hypothetical protein
MKMKIKILKFKMKNFSLVECKPCLLKNFMKLLKQEDLENSMILSKLLKIHRQFKTLEKVTEEQEENFF